MWGRGRNDGGEGEKGEIIEGGMMLGKWRKECGHRFTLQEMVFRPSEIGRVLLLFSNRKLLGRDNCPGFDPSILRHSII